MYIPGTHTYSKEGAKIQTGLVAGRISKDGELRFTKSGKAIGSVSVPAYDNQDGTTAWLTVKAWDGAAKLLGNSHKGDHVFAVGRLESREYNGRTYTDLIADYVQIQPQGEGSGSVRSGGVDVSAQDFEDLSESESDLPF